MTGHYGTGKTHLFYAQYREMAVAGKTRCHVRTSRELVEELRRLELDDERVSPVMAVTGNYSLRDLVERERMHPAIVRRLDDICRIIRM